MKKSINLKNKINKEIFEIISKIKSKKIKYIQSNFNEFFDSIEFFNFISLIEKKFKIKFNEKTIYKDFKNIFELEKKILKLKIDEKK